METNLVELLARVLYKNRNDHNSNIGLRAGNEQDVRDDEAKVAKERPHPRHQPVYQLAYERRGAHSCDSN